MAPRASAPVPAVQAFPYIVFDTTQMPSGPPRPLGRINPPPMPPSNGNMTNMTPAPPASPPSPMASSPSPMASPPPLPLASSPPSPSLPPPFSSPPPSPNITTSVSGRMLQQFEEVEPPQDEMALGRELQEAIVLYNTPAMVFAFWLSVATILVATIFVFRPTLFAGKIAMLGTLIKLVMLVSWVVEAFWTTFPGSSPFHVTGNGYFGSWLAVAFAAQMFYAVAPAMPEGRTSEVLSSKSVDAEVSKAAVEEDAMAL